MGKGVLAVDKDRVDPGHSRPTCDGGDNSVTARHFGDRFDATFEQRSDDRFIYELITDRQGGQRLRVLLGIRDGIPARGKGAMVNWRDRPG